MVFFLGPCLASAVDVGMPQLIHDQEVQDCVQPSQGPDTDIQLDILSRRLNELRET